MNPANEIPEAKKSEACEREERILSYWREKSIFEKTLQKSAPKGNWVFYDGPPYATGLPHFGHILPTTLKDVFPRYKTMQGYHVDRKWGWDCHGLPIENLVEKQLDLKNKKDIEEYGIDKFNKKARESVFTYVNEWKSIIPRLGRFADMDKDYRTMDASFMESVWWTFKTLFDKDLVYEGYKVMYVCPRCGTPLSNAEVAQGGYKDITDISAFVTFKLNERFKGHDNVSILAWTTTPWTLPGNSAIAVNPELEYCLVQVTDKNNIEQKIILAKTRLEILKTEYKILAEFTGADLAGLSYTPVFSYYTKVGTLSKTQEEKRSNAWKIYTAEFVTDTDGSGVVHIAPAFGEDDLNLANANNIPVIQHIGMDGLMKEEVTDFIGMPAKPKSANSSDHQKTDVEVIKYLAKNGALFDKLKIIHPYPHCWRCETPLLNYATNAWFVRVTSFKDRMVELNKTIKWLPVEIGEGRFGKWLENVRDWNVSRSRYWGTPMPIWRNEKGDQIEVLGSIHDIKRKIDTRGNKYVVMRHGESEANILGIIDHGNKNKYPLTEKGKKEVAESVERLKKSISDRGLKITCVYSSPIERTLETSNIAAEVLGFSKDKVITDARIREINCGEFEGRPWTEYHNYFKTDEDKLLERLPSGESNADVKKRVAEFLYEVDSKHENEVILVITHGLPLRLTHEIAAGKTNRDLLRKGWEDVPEDTGSHQWIDFVALPHNEDFEFDMHRPYIDSVTWKNDKGEIMKRVPEVFDVWYDSGSMPYATAHYPFENKNNFLSKSEGEKGGLFPADFIAEGLDQTRGWFYSLTVLAVALFDSVPFKNVVVNGLILADDGRKMSKSLNNFPPLIPTVEKYSADALRFLFAQSPAVHAEEVKFSEKSLDEVNKKVFMRLSNIVTFYSTYKNDGTSGDSHFSRPSSSKHILDKWILSRLDQVIDISTTALDLYELDKSARSINDFIDDMSTWYLRRSRDRFKSDDEGDRNAAINTTGYVLHTLAHVLAPIAPFFAEDLYLDLTQGKDLESVHLASWPKGGVVDVSVIENTAWLRIVVEKALAIRAKVGIKVRQPLASLTLDAKKYSLFADKEYADVLKDEINVKEIILAEINITAENADGILLDSVITKELADEGKVRELTRAIQDLRKKSGLSAGDIVTLQVSVESSFAEVLEKFSSEIKSIVNAREIKIGDLHLFDSTIAESSHVVGSESVEIEGQLVRIALMRSVL